MTTLEQVLETAMQLPDEQQEMLLKILHQRYHGNRRTEIAIDARKSLEAFEAGEFPRQSAQEAISELRYSLNQQG
jgi:hypothetical protein